MRKRLTIGIALSIMFASLTPAQAQAPVHREPPRIVVPLSPKSFALRLARLQGWPAKQFTCLVELWRRESNWRPLAKNRVSTAFGIWQGLTETSRDPLVQVVHGLRYIQGRYGTPCAALAHHNSHGWY